MVEIAFTTFSLIKDPSWLQQYSQLSLYTLTLTVFLKNENFKNLEIAPLSQLMGRLTCFGSVFFELLRPKQSCHYAAQGVLGPIHVGRP